MPMLLSAILSMPDRVPVLTTEGNAVTTANQNPEQVARDQIDKRLAEDGWFVQDKKSIDFNVGLGICQSAFKFDSRSASNFDPF